MLSTSSKFTTSQLPSKQIHYKPPAKVENIVNFPCTLKQDDGTIPCVEAALLPSIRQAPDFADVQREQENALFISTNQNPHGKKAEA